MLFDDCKVLCASRFKAALQLSCKPLTSEDSFDIARIAKHLRLKVVKGFGL